MENCHLEELAYFYFGTPDISKLLRIEVDGMISWRNVSSLKKVLSAVGRDDLTKDWEEFETKRSLALLLDASMQKIWQDIPRQNRFEYVEAILKPYPANYVLDKNTGGSLRKSKRGIAEVMISLKEKIETNLTEPWTEKLLLLIVNAVERLSKIETKNDEFANPLPEDVMRCSNQICSTIKSLGKWVRPINRWGFLKTILLSVVIILP